MASQLQCGISIVNGIASRVLEIISSSNFYCVVDGMRLQRKIGPHRVRPALYGACDGWGMSTRWGAPLVDNASTDSCFVDTPRTAQQRLAQVMLPKSMS